MRQVEHTGSTLATRVDSRSLASLHREAVLHATQAADRLRVTLTEAATRRAAAHLDRQVSLDKVRAAILEQWYQRCYRATVDSQLGLLQRLQAVTAAEGRQVAASMEVGQARRLIGDDGVPLVTVH